MEKKKDKPLGDHVKVSTGDNRPYIRVADLVQSKEFQEAIEYSKKNRNKLYETSSTNK